MPYLIWKAVHVLAVIVFLGVIMTATLYIAYAARTRDPEFIEHSLQGIRGIDRWFATPAIVVLLVAGFAGAAAGKIGFLSTGWMLWSFVLLIAALASFFGGAVPPARRLATLARAGDWTAFDTGLRRLLFWGWVAILSPAAAVVLMVLKPSLPALR